ncbi:hypothetical protein HID58_072966 [Brassica napus]|uniref:Uncharacterized protein n=1 Tax=Brassica napus TaxID=3708 RepID=A0ABQ7Z644_BRANA|nr:hypothetical protein HID58_072966 [Brassica napus]
MEDAPDISWGCNIDSVENATSLQRWLTNSGFPPKKMAVDRVDIREREECAQLNFSVRSSTRPNYGSCQGAGIA